MQILIYLGLLICTAGMPNTVVTLLDPKDERFLWTRILALVIFAVYPFLAVLDYYALTGVK